VLPRRGEAGVRSDESQQRVSVHCRRSAWIILSAVAVPVVLLCATPRTGRPDPDYVRIDITYAGNHVAGSFREHLNCKRRSDCVVAIPIDVNGAQQIYDIICHVEDENVRVGLSPKGQPPPMAAQRVLPTVEAPVAIRLNKAGRGNDIVLLGLPVDASRPYDHVQERTGINDLVVRTYFDTPVLGTLFVSVAPSNEARELFR
jgi:hypothetical protein